MTAFKTLFRRALVGGILIMTTALNDRYVQRGNALGWLVGTWTIDTGHGFVVEKWRILNDSTLSGRSVFVKAGNDTIPQESLVLSFRKGAWSYTSTVHGQNNDQPVNFRVIFQKGSEFICENPTHDFPQRIAYRRIDDALFASIEGTKNGRLRKENFDFIKANANK